MGAAGEIQLNGETRALAAPTPLRTLLTGLGVAPGSVVVELNGCALTPSEAATATVRPGDRLELIRAVAGG